MGALTTKTMTEVIWEDDRSQLRVVMIEGGVMPYLRVEVGTDVMVVNIDPEALHAFADNVLRAFKRQEP